MEVVGMHQAGGWNRILSKEACWHVGIREMKVVNDDGSEAVSMQAMPMFLSPVMMAG